MVSFVCETSRAGVGTMLCLMAGERILRRIYIAEG